MTRKKTILPLCFLTALLASCGAKTPSSSSVLSSDSSSEESSVVSSEPSSSPSSEESSSEEGEDSREANPTGLYRSEHSFLPDPNFKKGFRLMNTDSSCAKKVADLDYGRTEAGSPYWQMSQWWAASDEWTSKITEEEKNDPMPDLSGYDLKNATLSNPGEGVYEYKTPSESKDVTVDVNNGSLTFGVNAAKDYAALYKDCYNYGANSHWCHLLIEQTFPSEKKRWVSDLESCVVTFDFTLNYAEYEGVPTDNMGQCASFYVYTTLRNNPRGDKTTGYGTAGRYLWVGLPLWDNRYDFLAPYRHMDAGTSSFIYSSSSKEYLRDAPLVVGKTYHVEFDLLDLFQEAFLYGIENVDYFAGMDWTNMVFNYFNIGWEIPGAWNVSATMSQLDFYFTEK